jgi:hypothetical protein
VHSYYHLGPLVHSYFLWVIWLAFVVLFLLGLVEDMVIEVRVSFYKL